MANNLGSYPTNAPDHPLEMNCVYAISGTYGLLPRLLYYVTLVFAIFGRRKDWLIIGALVSALTYAATSAIHQMALTTSKREIFDLDIYGAYAILSTGALAYIAMMHWSETLKESKAKPIMVIWGFIVGIALIFARTEMFDNPLSDPEPACYSSTGQLLIYPIELISTQFNCTYKCFSATKPMRQHLEVMVVPHSILTTKYTKLSDVLIGPIQFVAYAALSWDSAVHSPSQICVRAVMKYLNPKHKEELVKLIYNASCDSWYGGYFVLFRFIRRSKWSIRKAVFAFLSFPWLVLGLIIDVLALPLMILNIISNELNILQPQLPTNEANYAIGQWGPVVTAVFVVIAAAFNRFMEMRTRVKSIEETERRNSAATMVGTPDVELAQGFRNEQEIGVVKPGMIHVQTLRDFDEVPERYR